MIGVMIKGLLKEESRRGQAKIKIERLERRNKWVVEGIERGHRGRC